MLRNTSKFWFSFTVRIISLFGFIISPSWLIIWVFLELNLIAVLPLLNNRLIFYFIIQSLGGLIFLFRRIFRNVLFILIRIMVKLAIFPFCFWILNVIDNSRWNGGAFLSRIRKLLPLGIIYNLMLKNITFFFFLTVLWGSLHGVIQTKIKKLLACSSVRHTGWLRLFISLKIKHNLVYVWSYFPLIFFLFFFNNPNKFLYWNSVNHIKLPLLTTLLILSGLPPFSGLWIKIIRFISLSHVSSIFRIMFFFISTFNLYFYFKLMLGIIKSYKFMCYKHIIICFILLIPQFLI